MRYCPHCRKPSARTSGTCPHCGKDLDGAAASKMAGGSGAYESMSSVEAESPGGLQIDYQPRSAPGPSPAAPAPPPSGIPDLADEDAEGPSLELDTASLTPPPSRLTPSPARLTPPPSGAPHPSVAPSHTGFPLIPSFTTDEPPEFDPEELFEKAKFGPVPANVLGAVSYALKVRTRSAELHAEATSIQPNVAKARDEVIEELSRLGERARVAGYKGNKEVESLLAAVAAADRSAESAEGAKSVEQRRHAQKMEEIDARIESVRERMEEPRLKESQLAGELGAKEGERRQLEMRIKRLEIEIRAAEEVIARSQTPGAQQPGSDSAALDAASDKLPSLQSELQQLRAKNSHLDDPIAELRARVAKVREELNGLKSERAAATKARDEEQALHEANNRGASSQSAQAQEELKVNLAEIGRAVRYDRNAPKWALELYPSVDEAAYTYAKLWTDHHRCLAAADSFDRSVVQKGYIMMFSGAGLAFVLVLSLLVLASNL
jgi:hypothetical protein